ncbi:MAG: YfaZ family outer membrane protein [Sulfurimonadaceae bacterium]|jgi:hypothetical protein
MLKKLALLGAAAASAFAMHSAEININDKDLELAGKIDMGQFNHTVDPDTVFIGAKFLRADGDNSDPEVHDLEEFYELSFLMQRNIKESGLAIGLGVKANHTEDFTSFPLGIEARYKLPLTNVVPLYLGGSLYYAPQVLSMDDARDFLEYRATLDIEVIENGNITLGYRKIETNYEIAGHRHDFTYNKSAYVGFKFRF